MSGGEMQMNAMPADWYRDPSAKGQVRYWDGTAWTQHTAPERAPVTTGMPVVLPTPDTPEQAAWKKRSTRRWLIGLAVLLAALWFGASQMIRVVSEPNMWDVSAQSACADFYDLTQQAATGQINDLEYLDGLKNAVAPAALSDNKEILPAILAISEAYSSGGQPLMAVGRMRDVCERAAEQD